MRLDYFQRRNKLKKINFLKITPDRKREYSIDPDGRIVLDVPKFKYYLLSWFIPASKSKNVRIKLDQLASVTWEQIDGKRNVQEICDTLKQNQEEKIKPLEEVETRVTRFLKQLYDQGHVNFIEVDGGERK